MRRTLLFAAVLLHPETALAVEPALAAPPSASAPAPPDATYALSWVRAEGAEACPSGRFVTAEVERRLGRPVFHPDAERAFEVEVTRFGGAYRSDVFVRDADGRVLGRRTLQSDEPGCEALLSATALAIALVIDPEATKRPSLAASPPASPPPSSSAFEPPPAPAPAPSAPPPEPPPPPPSSTPPASPSAPRGSLAPASWVSVALRAELTGGVVPGASPGAQLAFEARPWARWGFSLAAAYVAPTDVERGVASMSFSFTRGSALVTFEAARAARLRLVLGLGPTLGVWHLAVREPSPVTGPGDYRVAAAEGSLSLQLLLTHRVFVELGGSAFVALGRQRFAVRGQDDPVWQQPVLSGRGFAGVGLAFL